MMIEIMGLIAAFSTGIFCYFVAHSVAKNRTRNRYEFLAKGSINIIKKSQSCQERSIFPAFMRSLQRSKIGSLCLKIAVFQTWVRALCGRTSAIFEFTPYPYQACDWQRLTGFISGMSVVLFGTVLFAISRNILLCVCFAVLILFFVPTFMGQASARMKNHKRREYERALPEMLSVIVLSVQAGATFDTAFEAYASRFSSSLAHESKSAYELYISQVTSRGEALDTLAREVDSEPFYHFVATVKRALYLGSPLGIALENQLHDMREYREERIKEEIAKKPVQILLPLGVFILPGMLILLLGPILMEVMQGISMR